MAERLPRVPWIDLSSLKPIGQVQIVAILLFTWEIKWKLFSHIQIVGPKVFPVYCVVQLLSNILGKERGRITYQSSFHRRAKTKRFQMLKFYARYKWDFLLHLCTQSTLSATAKAALETVLLFDRLLIPFSLIDFDNYIGPSNVFSWTTLICILQTCY